MSDKTMIQAAHQPHNPDNKTICEAGLKSFNPSTADASRSDDEKEWRISSTKRETAEFSIKKIRFRLNHGDFSRWRCESK